MGRWPLGAHTRRRIGFSPMRCSSVAQTSTGLSGCLAASSVTTAASFFETSRTPPAWPRPDGGGAASAPTSRSPSGPPSRIGARPRRARVRLPSKPLLWGRSIGPRRTAASQAARATAPEAQGAARSVRCRYGDASPPGPRGHVRCSGPAVAQSSAAQSSSPPPHPRSCAPALTTRSPESAASRSDAGPTGASLPDRPRSDDQQPAPWLASATHGPPAYPLLNNPGILNPSPSPGARIRRSKQRSIDLLNDAIRTLLERIQEHQAFQPDSQAASALPVKEVAHNRKVFVVHGHDEGAREAIARFLEKIDLEAII